MAQVTRTVNDLIASAFFLIGEFDEEEPIPGADFERGFDLLNLMIDHFSGENFYIAYTEDYSFNLTPNKKNYSFSNVSGITPDFITNRIAALEYVNINIDNLIYPVDIISRSELFLNRFDENIKARPQYVILNRKIDESVLSFYAIPDQAYACEIKAKFYINKFEKFQQLRNIPLSLHRFFIYALGRELLAYYPSGNWGETQESTYNQMMDDLLNTNDIDMMVRPSGLLRRKSRFYYGSLASLQGGP